MEQQRVHILGVLSHRGRARLRCAVPKTAQIGRDDAIGGPERVDLFPPNAATERKSM
jgi:hypothetical protein